MLENSLLRLTVKSGPVEVPVAGTTIAAGGVMLKSGIVITVPSYTVSSTRSPTE